MSEEFENTAVEQLVRSVHRDLQDARVESYRRALRQIGCMPQTIQLLVERDREWLATGHGEEE